MEFVQILNRYNTSEMLARFVEGEEQGDEQIFLQGMLWEKPTPTKSYRCFFFLF